MAELWRVSLNEWLKLLRRKRLWVAAALALVIVALFTYGTYRDSQSTSRYNSPAFTQQQIQDTKQSIAQIKTQPVTAQSKQELQQMQNQLSSLQQQYGIQRAESAGNWKPVVQKHITQLNQELKSMGTTQQDQVMAANIKTQLLTLNYEVKHNVKPLLPWQTSAYTSLGAFFDFVASLFLPLLIVIMIADMVAGETTSGTVKLLLIRPVSRTKILLGKWFVSLFATVLISLATFFAMLGAGIAVIGGQGATQPEVVGTTYKFLKQTGIVSQGGSNGLVAVPQLGHAHVLPAWVYTVDAILLITLAMLVVATVAFLSSVLFKSAMASTAVAMGVMILGTILLHLIHSKWVMLWFPVHLDLTQDWTGAVSRQLQMSVGLGAGLLVLAGWLIVSIVISIVKFKRQDILNA